MKPAKKDPRAHLDSQRLQNLHRYWQAANYLTIGQIYLQDNPLLREPLRTEHTAAGPEQSNASGKVVALLLPPCRQPLCDVLTIMRDSGMRNQKEVFTMRWEYVDWGNSRYYVYESKWPGGRRFVPLSPRVQRALRVRQPGRSEGLVIPSKRSTSGHLTTVTRLFQKARNAAGLPKHLVLYCAHHGFGTDMYRATKNLFAVMKVMGHAAVTTTMKYQHQDIDDCRCRKPASLKNSIDTGSKS